MDKSAKRQYGTLAVREIYGAEKRGAVEASGEGAVWRPMPYVVVRSLCAELRTNLLLEGDVKVEQRISDNRTKIQHPCPGRKDANGIKGDWYRRRARCKIIH